MTIADRVKDTSTSTGTGNFVLSGSAPTGFQALSAIGSTGATFGYVIDGGAEWEVGTGTITAANTFSRAPTASSNAGALVNFSAGTKAVFHSVTAAQHAKYQSTNTASFATAIPLTAVGNTYMPQQTVSAVLAFTAGASPVQGALVYVRLVADGTNAPTFTGFNEWGGSLGYDNRAGIVNEVQFFYDGYDYWYSISQAVGAVAVDTTAPTASSAAVENATPTFVDITFSEAMDQTVVPAIGTVVASGHTTTALAYQSATVLRATVTAAFVNGEASRSLVITPNGTNNLRDLTANQITTTQTITTITNNVAAAASAVTMTGPTGGVNGVASTNFTLGVSPVGGTITGTVVVTPSDGGAGGTFTPTTKSLTSGAPSGTFTYAPASTGAKTISVTNNGGLTNPSNITYTATASDTTKPAFSSAQVANAAPADIVITMDETLAAFTPATSAFAASGGRTVTGVARSGATVTVTVNTAYANGDTITITYTKPGSNMLQDAAGNQTDSFGPSSVTNNISAASSLRALAGFTMLTEGGSDPNWTYTGTGGGAFDATGAVFNKGLASGALGSFSAVRSTAANLSIQPALCAIAGTTLLGLAARVGTMLHASDGPYIVYLGSSGQTAENVVNAAVGDWMRIRRSATTTLVYEVSQNSGSSWTSIFTQTGAPSTAINFQVQIIGAAGGVLSGFVGTGLS